MNNKANLQCGINIRKCVLCICYIVIYSMINTFSDNVYCVYMCIGFLKKNVLKVTKFCDSFSQITSITAASPQHHHQHHRVDERQYK